MRQRAVPALIVTLSALLWTGPVSAQTTPPLGQDEFDLQGRYNMVLGAGARALGMGGAFLARADDATAASWNPAGLSYLLRPEVSLVGGINRVRIDSSAETDVFRGAVPDFLAVTYPLAGLPGAAQISFQRMIPFSGHRTIERDRTVESEKSLAALEADGGFDVIAFGTGFRATSNLRIGATLNHWMNGFHQELTRSRSTGRLTQIVADFGFSGWNVNMGFIWSPRENLNIGGVAKTPFSGRVRLWKEKTDYFPGSGDGASTTSQNALRRDDLRIDFPAAFGLGASWRLRSSLTLAADYTRTEWSNAQIHNFFVLRTPEPDPAVFEDLPYPLLDAHQNDTEQIRIGAEYVVLRARLKWPLRIGYIFDRQYFESAAGTSPVFRGLTVGTGLILGPVLLDVAYLREVGRFDSATKVATTHNTRRFFVSLIYRHGAAR